MIEHRYAMHIVFRLVWGQRTNMPEPSLRRFEAKEGYSLTIDEYHKRILRLLGDGDD